MKRFVLVTSAALVAAACSSDPAVGASDAGASDDASHPEAAACSSPGAAVNGPPDTHCTDDGGMIVQTTDPASCRPDGATAHQHDAGASDGGGHDSGGPDYGPTLYGQQGDEDDCKYHLTWTATRICQDQDVTFTVKVNSKLDMSPVAGAAVSAEVLLSDTHPGPYTNQMWTEGPPGTYVVGPVQFDLPGQWTVRLHFFPMCSDALPDSPHGHAAFYVKVGGS